MIKALVFFVSLMTVSGFALAIDKAAQFKESYGMGDLNRSTQKAIEWNSEDVISSGIISADEEYITVAVSGVYQISYSLNWTRVIGDNSGVRSHAEITGQPGAVQGSMTWAGGGDTAYALDTANKATFLVQLEAGDSLRIYAMGAAFSSTSGVATSTTSYVNVVLID